MKKHSQKLLSKGLVALFAMGMIACSSPKYYMFNANDGNSTAKAENEAGAEAEQVVQSKQNLAITEISKEVSQAASENAVASTEKVVIAENVHAKSIEKEITAMADKMAAGEKVSKFEQAKTALKVKKELKQLEKELSKENGTAAEGKSQLIALILVILVGALGIHRFYLGYTTIGIIQLLTLGGCGVWALIDLIRIAMGDLGPKDGAYDETL